MCTLLFDLASFSQPNYFKIYPCRTIQVLAFETVEFL